MAPPFLWTFLAALAITWPGVYLFRRLAPRLGLLDIPNERSAHAWPVPRAGGLVFVVVTPLVALIAARALGVRLDRADWALLAGGWLVAGVSLVDDWRGLSARTRLLAQAWAAGALIVFAGYVKGLAATGLGLLDWGALGIPLDILKDVNMKFYEFHDTKLSGIVENAPALAVSPRFTPLAFISSICT